MTEPTSSMDPERVEFWGRRIPRLLATLGRWMLPVMLGILAFAGIHLSGAEQLTPPSGLPLYLKYTLAVVGVSVFAVALDRSAAALRKRFLPPIEAGFMGFGPLEISSWKARQLEYWPLAFAVLVTPVLLYFAGTFARIALDVPVLVPLAVLLALQGPVMLWFGFRLRRRFREWKQQQEDRS